MKLEVANEILSGCNFMGLKFTIKEMGSLTYMVINWRAPDTRDTTAVFNGQFIDQIDLDITPKMLVEKAYHCVNRLLKHEASEIFKFHGMDIFNEHHPTPNVISQMFLC